MRNRTIGAALAAALSLVACATPTENTSSTTVTTDPRYLAGTLSSWEASLAVGQASEDLSGPLDADETSAGSGTSALTRTGIVVDDNETPDDKTDDILTITYNGTHWSGFVMTKVVVRPRKPVVDQFATADSVIAQTVLEKWYATTDTSGTPFADITMDLTWKLTDGAVVLDTLNRTGERIGFRQAQPQILTLDVQYTDGCEWKKTVNHYTGSVADENLLYTEVFERLSEADVSPVVTKVSTYGPDGDLTHYRIITREGSGSQSIEKYNAAGLLRETIERHTAADGWTLSRSRYKVDGETVKWTSSETVVITQDGDTTHLVRTVTLDGERWQVSMDVTVSGDTYLVSKTASDGTIRTWTAEKQDGSWIITEDGVETVVAADDAI